MYSLYKWNPSVTLVTAYWYNTLELCNIKKCKRMCLKRETLHIWCVLFLKKREAKLHATAWNCVFKTFLEIKGAILASK